MMCKCPKCDYPCNPINVQSSVISERSDANFKCDKCGEEFRRTRKLTALELLKLRQQEYQWH